MREEKGKRRKEKENDSEGRSRRGRKGRRKGRRYASGLKPPPQTKNAGYVPADFARQFISFSAPVVWNSLPANVLLCNCESGFKKHLKTFIFVIHVFIPPD